MAAPGTAPRIWQDALDVGAWILQHLRGADPLSLRAHERAIDLVEAAAVALAPAADRCQALTDLDRANLVLRANLRLAEHAGLLAAGPYADITARLDAIGRQIGGWKRAEASAIELEGRR